MRSTLLDTGAIVGFLLTNDSHHQASLAALESASRSGRAICTTWEAIGEAYTLIRVRYSPPNSAAPAMEVLRWSSTSGVHILASNNSDHLRAAQLLEAYAQLRLSYVDALILSVAERTGVEEVITVDAAHFGTVKLAHRLKVTVV